MARIIDICFLGTYQEKHCHIQEHYTEADVLKSTYKYPFWELKLCQRSLMEQLFAVNNYRNQR